MAGAAASAACVACGAADAWSMQDGLLVCERCGTQSQNYIEETQEFQVGDNTRRRTLHIGKRKRPQAPDEGGAFPVQELVQGYCSCLQAALQQGASALHKDFGVDEAVESVVRRLWLACVADSGILSSTFCSDVEAAAAGYGPKTEDGGPENDRQQKRRQSQYAALKSVLWKALHPDIVLVVQFLAAWLLRAPLTAMDFITAATAAQLPHLDMSGFSEGPGRPPPALLNPIGARRRIVSSFTPASVSWPCSLLAYLQKQVHATGPMGVHQLLAKAADTAERLQLRLPPANIAALACRFVLELGMPQPTWEQAVAPAAIELLRVHSLGTAPTQLQPAVSLQPYAAAMAAVVVALRMLYGLGNRAAQSEEQPSGSGADTAPDWGKWVAETLCCLREPCALPMDTAKVHSLSHSQFLEWLAYTERLVLPGLAVPDELKEFSRLLRTAAAKPVSDDSQSIPGPGPGGNPEASEPGAEAGRLPLPVRQQYTLLGPPTSSVSWTVDPAYACVLLLCACYLWLQPFFLHRVVCQLELDIARAEINLDVATQTE